MNGPYGGAAATPQSLYPTEAQINQSCMPSKPAPMNGSTGGVMFDGGGSSSKFWDNHSRNQFTEQMTQRMQQILGYNKFGPTVISLTQLINQASDEMLKSMQKPNYKYISHTLLI